MLTLGNDVPRFVGAALRGVPGVAVVDGAPETSIVRRGGAQVLRLEVLGVSELARRLEAGDLIDDRSVLIAVEGVLDDRTAARLEDLGVSYADVDGRAWIAGKPRTARALSRKNQGRHLRPESLRLAQLIADHPMQGWTQRSLAARGESTQVTAQRLLRRLEDGGLMARTGAGRATTRALLDAPAMRRWLLEHGRPGPATRLPFFVRDAAAVPDRVENINLALTGAAAAERLGIPVMTASPIPAFRADCGPERLEDVPALLGGFRTDTGAAAVLIADPKRLAHVDARRLDDGKLVAPPSRIMLDLLLEHRGGAAAELFADLWRDDR